MQFVSLTAHFSNHDAVCNDAVLRGEFLQGEGHQVFYYAPSADKNFRKPLLSRHAFKALATNPETIVIYEHCIFMPAYDELFRDSHCEIWLRYHNITPPKFYAPYDSEATHATQKGLDQTLRIVKDHRVRRFIATSQFTADDLVRLGADRNRVQIIAPLSRLEDFDRCKVDRKTASKLTENRDVNNLLFVGRVVPNKGHRHLIETVRAYTRLHGSNVHLWIVGALMPQYRKYYAELERLINRYALGDRITFTGSLTFDSLHTFYKYTDTFLLLSEHEGFCVPITEAQYHQLPIVAVDCGPFGDVLGPEQLMIEKYDYEFLATACARIKRDGQLAARLAKAGTEQLKRHTPALLNMRLKEILELHQHESHAN